MSYSRGRALHAPAASKRFARFTRRGWYLHTPLVVVVALRTIFGTALVRQSSGSVAAGLRSSFQV